jgi:hypothetical protein
MLEWDGNTRNYKGRTHIICTTLDTVDKAFEEPEDIFLWMDIEGAEMKALKGGLELLESARVKWISLEIGTKRRRIGEPSFEDLQNLLLGYGYTPIHRYHSKSKFMNVIFEHKSIAGQST